MKEKVEKSLDKIRPALMADGGNVELVEVKDDVVKVKLGGACTGCPLSTATLNGWVQGTIHQFFPEVTVEPAD